jgi:orotate phosphoribosyltransferase
MSSLSDFSKKRRALVEHLRAHGLRTDGPFQLRSGVVSSWYLDARQTTFDGAGAQAVAAAILEVLDERVQAVGGMTMGADPIALATAMSATQSGRPMRSFSIRKEAKSHGAGGRLVGPVTAGDAVAVLEDTTTTGGALLEALEVAVSSGLQVVQAIALVDRSGSAVRDRMSRSGIAYLALITPEDLGVAE